MEEFGCECIVHSSIAFQFDMFGKKWFNKCCTLRPRIELDEGIERDPYLIQIAFGSIRR